MTFSLSPGSKFACIAIEAASVADDFKGPLALRDGLWVLTSPPFEVDSTWKSWLGSIWVRDYHRSNLLLFAVAPSTRPEIVDDENMALEKAVYHFFCGVLLHGVPALGAGLALGGANERGTVTSAGSRRYRPTITILTPSSHSWMHAPLRVLPPSPTASVACIRTPRPLTWSRDKPSALAV